MMSSEEGGKGHLSQRTLADVLAEYCTWLSTVLTYDAPRGFKFVSFLKFTVTPLISVYLQSTITTRP